MAFTQAAVPVATPFAVRRIGLGISLGIRLGGWAIGLMLQCLLFASPVGGAEPVAPDVDFSATPSIDKVERGQSVPIFLSISNKSNAAVIIKGVTVYADGFRQAGDPGDEASSLPAFGSVQRTITVTVLADALFAEHKLVLAVEYTFQVGGQVPGQLPGQVTGDKKKKVASPAIASQTLTSARSTTVYIEVRRRFEEEAKGFPGGTAAFLYLLLPVIPAFLSYRMLEDLRTTRTLKMPVFSSEHIVPAFFAAILVSFVTVWTTRQDTGPDYSSPKTFVKVLMISFLVGGAVPGGRFVSDLYRNLRWGFKPRDAWDVYAHKALLGKKRPEKFEWVKFTAKGQNLEGILLEQPDGRKVLGARFQVAPAKQEGEDYSTVTVPRIARDVVSRKGVLINADLLVRMLREGKLVATPLKEVRRGSDALSGVRVIDLPVRFKETGRDDEPVVLLVP